MTIYADSQFIERFYLISRTNHKDFGIQDRPDQDFRTISMVDYEWRPVAFFQRLFPGHRCKKPKDAGGTFSTLPAGRRLDRPGSLQSRCTCVYPLTGPD